MGSHMNSKRTGIGRNEEEEESLILKMVPENILFEILVRVPDPKTAVGSGSVCKAWRSVVFSPEFIPAFIRQHPPSPSSYTMLIEFKFIHHNEPRVLQLRYCHKVLTVDGSEVAVTHPATTRFRDIIPNLHLESASHDLMLVAPFNCEEFCVFRPTTRHRHVIPRQSPLREHLGYRALAVRPDRCDFRILHIMCLADGRFQSTIFSSETGQWSEPADNAPALSWRCDVVSAADGTLFWVDYSDLGKAVVFDPFSGAWSYIAFPANVVPPGSLKFYFLPSGEVPVYGSDEYRMTVGAVRGRVRMSQLVFFAPYKSYVLKVWELEDTGCWRMVHSDWVKPQGDAKWICLLALDPDDGDIIYLCRGSDLYRYHIREQDFRWVFKLSCSMKGFDDISEDLLPRYVRATIITRPVWPANVTVPSLQTYTPYGQSLFQI